MNPLALLYRGIGRSGENVIVPSLDTAGEKEEEERQGNKVSLK